ncbi:MAG TPA: type I-E CRISPR-associated protein Cse1/CasA, partial [Ruminococcus sp.]|nr:type I-E CRISPR-associated protein Cse1/CasA [Ruminococcus sp.]
MKDIEFNLLDEPWVRVMDGDCNVVELSLKDTIINAHKYKSLKGELPTQDIAVMRLILAVLHTIFSRVDENGEEESIDSKKDALKRWKALWDKGKFSEKAVCEYFEKWHERFWLFHPDRPFGQVAGLKSGTDYTSAKLNGEISESSNKIRLFASYSGEEKQSLTYSQTARWILYLNGYDDTSSKASKAEKERAKKEGREVLSTGAGWLGKLGLIFIKGNNLFETLMLNLVMINSGEVQSEQKPAWENETVSKRERFEIAMPDNLAELYTLQSRRLILVRNNDRVTGYK